MFELTFRSKECLHDRKTLKALFPKLAWGYSHPTLLSCGNMRILCQESLSDLFWDQEFEDAVKERLEPYDVPLEEILLKGNTVSFYYVKVFPTLDTLRGYINREILRKESQPDYRICSHSYKAWDTRLDELVLIHRKTLDITDLVEERDGRAWERFGKAGIIKVEPC